MKEAYDRAREARQSLQAYIEARTLVGDKPSGALLAARMLLSETLDALLPDRPLLPDEERGRDDV